MKIAYLLTLFLILFKTGSTQVSTDFSTNLPLVNINTNGSQIVDEPKISADLQIIYQGENSLNKIGDEANIYNGKIGIEIRGASSSHYPQKPYLFETRDLDGNNNNVSLLGMPVENDWCLLSFYNDKSLIRNILAFQLFENMGNYAPRARLCELILNNEYKGIYLLTEKIKRDKGRVDIAKLKQEDRTGEEVTGGYIFKIDYHHSNDSWKSPYSPIDHQNFNVHFVYHDPKPDELIPDQKEYLKGYVTEFESVLYGNDFKDKISGYSKYIDVNSFIDYFLISEVSRNNDGFKKSRYFHKDKNGKIVAGPVWDFDWAWKNINECHIFKATDGSGWAYKVNDCNPGVKSPGWMIRLFQDTDFKNEINCKYNTLREGILSNQNILAIIDSVYNLANEAQVRHFQKWQILGRNVGAPEIDAQPSTYAGEVQKLKNWVETRLNWLDENMLGNCINTSSYELAEEKQLKMFPNPASNYITIEASRNLEQLQVYDFTGKIILSENVNSERLTQNISELKPGFYIVKAVFKDGHVISTKLIKN